jgi:hypothetical protein
LSLEDLSLLCSNFMSSILTCGPFLHLPPIWVWICCPSGGSPGQTLHNWWTGFRFYGAKPNKLPTQLRNTKSLQTYKSLLKAHLFAAAFGDNSAWEYPALENLSA